jgi:hypothetical protein
VPLLASGIVLLFTVINLCGVKWAMRSAVPSATASAALAFLSAVLPVVSGSVDWQQAFTFRLVTPFAGWFGQVTSVMAGLYLIGFAAHLQARYPGLPVVLGTGWGAEIDADEAKQRGIQAVLSKPYGLDSIRQLLARCAAAAAGC